MNNRVGGAFVVYNKGLEVYCHGFRLSDHETAYSAERMPSKLPSTSPITTTYSSLASSLTQDQCCRQSATQII
ncbi:hypothetical protein CEXT_639861 [Caerostris extrusa]|uniref:Uncharacterized protein n=1 Tax=Caerostris extrusa TaxID=172846 RepID=A0AAV4Y2Y8_CAEEX|nr:hypothetical protein CEXT_639861 [Caerostris extrusa]